MAEIGGKPTLLIGSLRPSIRASDGEECRPKCPDEDWQKNSHQKREHSVHAFVRHRRVEEYIGPVAFPQEEDEKGHSLQA